MNESLIQYLGNFKNFVKQTLRHKGDIMKISHILLAVVGVAFIGTQFLKGHVNSLISGSNYKGPTVQLDARITKLENVCRIKTTRGFYSHTYDCSKKEETKKRVDEGYSDGVVQTVDEITYEFQLEQGGEIHTDTVLYLKIMAEFSLRRGKKLPIVVGLEDPTYTQPDYDKINSN